MGFFDIYIEKKEFDQFKSATLQKIVALSEEIKRKATDSEEIARAAASNAVEIESKIRENEANILSTFQNLELYKEQALNELQDIQNEKQATLENNNKLIASTKASQDLLQSLIATKEGIDEAASTISEKVDEVSEILNEAQQLPEAVESTKNLIGEAESLNEKLKNLLSHSMKRKSEIDELHKSICGHDVKDEEGNTEHIDGLKDELENSYETVRADTEALEGKINSLTKKIHDTHTKSLNEKIALFEELVAESKTKITAVNDQLTALLPGAMATGLSAAYEGKKKEETELLDKFDTTFKLSIVGLILVSLIPFSVDIYLLGWQGKDLVQVIKETPNLIISILPLYFPVLWLAYSTNKKINLSKRLIEEYTHKAVLGMTLSGLSNQIETLPHESVIKEDLRTRLLFNVLQVSSENPGKLISNYNKSDHPLMEALENSSKLSDSVEALSKIPGLSALARKISEKGDDLLRMQQEKIENGFAAQEILNPPQDAEKAS